MIIIRIWNIYNQLNEFHSELFVVKFNLAGGSYFELEIVEERLVRARFQIPSTPVPKPDRRGESPNDSIRPDVSF